MKKEKAKGMWNEAAGEVKERIGRATGNADLEQRGHDQEMKGKAERAAGTVKETAGNVKNNIRSGARDIGKVMKD